MSQNEMDCPEPIAKENGYPEPKGEKMIECKICHKKVNVLTTHLRMAHKMPKKVYADAFHETEFVSDEAKKRFSSAQNPDRTKYQKGGRPRNAKTE